MTRETYQMLDTYMQPFMTDAVHDVNHIHRVLNVALNIAETEENVDFDVLITACLLHDIGRQAEMNDRSLCHAKVGSEMAYAYLTEQGFENTFAAHVRDCIATHRFRKDAPPHSIEAKILYDADKVDVAGALGIARTLMFKAALDEPLYTMLSDGTVSDGSQDSDISFFQEYHYKLKHLYGKFFTKRAAEIAREREVAAANFYESMLREVTESHSLGADVLSRHLCSL